MDDESEEEEETVTGARTAEGTQKFQYLLQECSIRNWKCQNTPKQIDKQ